MSHTQGIWRAGRNDTVSYHCDGRNGPYKNVYVDDPNGKMHMGERLPAVVCEAFDALGADCRDNAERIAHCVNTHDELVAALEKALAVIVDAIMHGMPITEQVADARNSICAALRNQGKDGAV